jgi:hypothetical protein
MPPSNNSSFIPKQTGNKLERKNTPRRVFIGTIIVRIVFFAVLIAAIALFVYERKLQTELSEESFEILQIASSFDVAKMEEIQVFNERIKQTSSLIDNYFSVHSLFALLSNNTLDSVQIINLDLAREGADKYKVTAQMSTDIYDSVMVQRDILLSNSLITESHITDIQKDIATPTRPSSLSEVAVMPVSFKTELIIDRNSLPISYSLSTLNNQPVAAPSVEEVTAEADVPLSEN